jgi:hypothetical protein
MYCPDNVDDFIGDGNVSRLSLVPTSSRLCRTSRYEYFDPRDTLDEEIRAPYVPVCGNPASERTILDRLDSIASKIEQQQNTMDLIMQRLYMRVDTDERRPASVHSIQGAELGRVKSWVTASSDSQNWAEDGTPISRPNSPVSDKLSN